MPKPQLRVKTATVTASPFPYSGTAATQVRRNTRSSHLYEFHLIFYAAFTDFSLPL